MEIWESKTLGTLWVTPGLLRDYFTFMSLYRMIKNLCASDDYNT